MITPWTVSSLDLAPRDRLPAGWSKADRPGGPGSYAGSDSLCSHRLLPVSCGCARCGPAGARPGEKVPLDVCISCESRAAGLPRPDDKP